MNRFSVIYLLDEQYHHMGYPTYSEAQAFLHSLSADGRRTPLGIYDAKTELFEWEPTRGHDYNRADIQEQGKLGDQIITIAQSLRLQEVGRQSVNELPRPGLLT